MNNRKEKSNFFIKVVSVYLFPLYIVALLLKKYDFFKTKITDFVLYKILKRQKEQKAEDWWIS